MAVDKSIATHNPHRSARRKDVEEGRLPSSRFTHECSEFPRSDVSRNVVEQLPLATGNGDRIIDVLPRKDSFIFESRFLRPFRLALAFLVFNHLFGVTRFFILPLCRKGAVLGSPQGQGGSTFVDKTGVSLGEEEENSKESSAIGNDYAQVLGCNS